MNESRGLLKKHLRRDGEGRVGRATSPVVQRQMVLPNPQYLGRDRDRELTLPIFGANSAAVSRGQASDRAAAIR